MIQVNEAVVFDIHQRPHSLVHVEVTVIHMRFLQVPQHKQIPTFGLLAIFSAFLQSPKFAMISGTPNRDGTGGSSGSNAIAIPASSVTGATCFMKHV
jgi:hypothetical protein